MDLILSSVFRAPFCSFGTIFFLFMKHMEDKGILSSEDDGQFPGKESVSCSGTCVHYLLILQLQAGAPD